MLDNLSLAQYEKGQEEETRSARGNYENWAFKFVWFQCANKPAKLQSSLQIFLALLQYTCTFVQCVSVPKLLVLVKLLFHFSKITLYNSFDEFGRTGNLFSNKVILKKRISHYATQGEKTFLSKVYYALFHDKK